MRANRLDVATQMVLELVKSGGYPVPRIFRYYMKTLASIGNHKTIAEIGEYLNPVSDLKILMWSFIFIFIIISGAKKPLELRERSCFRYCT